MGILILHWRLSESSASEQAVVGFSVHQARDIVLLLQARSYLLLVHYYRIFQIHIRVSFDKRTLDFPPWDQSKWMKKVKNLFGGKKRPGPHNIIGLNRTMAEVVRGELLPYDLNQYLHCRSNVFRVLEDPPFLPSLPLFHCIGNPRKSVNHVKPNCIVSRNRREGQIRHRYSHPLPDWRANEAQGSNWRLHARFTPGSPSYTHWPSLSSAGSFAMPSNFPSNQ